jgi:hypothetical protein
MFLNSGGATASAEETATRLDFLNKNYRRIHPVTADSLNRRHCCGYEVVLTTTEEKNLYGAPHTDQVSLSILMQASEVLLNARCTRLMNASLEKSLEARNSIVEPDLNTCHQEELYETRKLVHNHREIPIRLINMLS